MKQALKNYIASHKGTINSMVGAVSSGAAGAAYTCLKAGRIDLKAIGLGGLIALFALLAGFGKAPGTPKADPPQGGNSQ